MQYQTAYGDAAIHSTSAVSLQKIIRIAAHGFAVLNFCFLPNLFLPFFLELLVSSYTLFFSLLPESSGFTLLSLYSTIIVDPQVLAHPVASKLPFPTTFLAVSGSAMPTMLKTVAPNITSAQNTHSKSPLPKATQPPITGPRHTARFAAPWVGPNIAPLSAGGQTSATTPNAIASTAEAPRLCNARNIRRAA